MEAKALYDFSVSREDELAFRRGDTIKVLNMEDSNWYRGEMSGMEGFIPATYIQMEPHDWYKGKMSRTEAEAHLTRKEGGRDAYHDGYFIVRDSESDQNSFSLSVKHGSQPQHFKILSNSSGQYYIWPNAIFMSINKLIDHHRNVSVSHKSGVTILLKDQAEQEGSNMYEALYAFAAQQPDEVTFQKGDRIQLIEKTDENWWKGKNVRTNQQGLFPINYVKQLSS